MIDQLSWSCGTDEWKNKVSARSYYTQKSSKKKGSRRVPCVGSSDRYANLLCIPDGRILENLKEIKGDAV